MLKKIFIVFILGFSLQSFSQINKALSEQLIENFTKSKNNSTIDKNDKQNKIKRVNKGKTAILTPYNAKVHNAFIFEIKKSNKRHIPKLKSLSINEKLEKSQMKILSRILERKNSN